MLTHLQIRDFAIIDLVELEVARRTHRAHRRNRRRQIHHGRRAGAAGRRQGRRRSRARGHRTRRTVGHASTSAGSPAALRELLAEQSVEAEDELTVRRVIAADGRSRGYLNGVSVPAAAAAGRGRAYRRYPRATRIPVADARAARSASCSTISARTSSSRTRCARPTRSGSPWSTAPWNSKARGAIVIRASNCFATRSASSRRSI